MIIERKKEKVTRTSGKTKDYINTQGRQQVKMDKRSEQVGTSQKRISKWPINI